MDRMTMSVRRGRLVAAALVSAAFASACSSPKPAPPPAPASKLIGGDMKAVVSVKELMQNMIDPVADNIFDAWSG